MAEEFQTGVCSGSWWNTSRSGLDGSTVAAARASCSVGVTDIGAAFGWTPEAMEANARSCEEAVATASGGYGVTFQDAPRVHITDPMVTGGFLMGTTPLMSDFSLSSPTADWSQALLSVLTFPLLNLFDFSLVELHLDRSK